jgi:hypothetical protein
MAVGGKKLKALVERDSSPFGGKKFKKPVEEEPEKDEEGEEDEAAEEEDNPGNEDESEEGEGEEVDVAAIGSEVQEGRGEPEIMELTKGYDPEQHGNPPSWVEDEEIWEKAKEAVDPEGDGSKYDQPWAVVAHVYSRMGGGLKSEGGGDEEETEE